MNFSNPILICDQSEEFRLLIRDMLTRNGFFHVMEATNEEEVFHHLHEKRNALVLINGKMLTREIIAKLPKKYLVFSDPQEASTLLIASRLGVDHLISFPVHSKKLVDKIHSIL